MPAFERNVGIQNYQTSVKPGINTFNGNNAYSALNDSPEIPDVKRSPIHVSMLLSMYKIHDLAISFPTSSLFYKVSSCPVTTEFMEMANVLRSLRDAIASPIFNPFKTVVFEEFVGLGIRHMPERRGLLSDFSETQIGTLLTRCVSSSLSSEARELNPPMSPSLAGVAKLFDSLLYVGEQCMKIISNQNVRQKLCAHDILSIEDIIHLLMKIFSRLLRLQLLVSFDDFDQLCMFCLVPFTSVEMSSYDAFIPVAEIRSRRENGTNLNMLHIDLTASPRYNAEGVNLQMLDTGSHRRSTIASVNSSISGNSYNIKQYMGDVGRRKSSTLDMNKDKIKNASNLNRKHQIPKKNKHFLYQEFDFENFFKANLKNKNGEINSHDNQIINIKQNDIKLSRRQKNGSNNCNHANGANAMPKSDKYKVQENNILSLVPQHQQEQQNNSQKLVIADDYTYDYKHDHSKKTDLLVNYTEFNSIPLLNSIPDPDNNCTEPKFQLPFERKSFLDCSTTSFSSSSLENQGPGSTDLPYETIFARLGPFRRCSGGVAQFLASIPRLCLLEAISSASRRDYMRLVKEKNSLLQKIKSAKRKVEIAKNNDARIRKKYLKKEYLRAEGITSSSADTPLQVNPSSSGNNWNFGLNSGHYDTISTVHNSNVNLIGQVVNDDNPHHGALTLAQVMAEEELKSLELEYSILSNELSNLESRIKTNSTKMSEEQRKRGDAMFIESSMYLSWLETLQAVCEHNRKISQTALHSWGIVDALLGATLLLLDANTHGPTNDRVMRCIHSLRTLRQTAQGPCFENQRTLMRSSLVPSICTLLTNLPKSFLVSRIRIGFNQENEDNISSYNHTINQLTYGGQSEDHNMKNGLKSTNDSQTVSWSRNAIPVTNIEVECLTLLNSLMESHNGVPFADKGQLQLNLTNDNGISFDIDPVYLINECLDANGCNGKKYLVRRISKFYKFLSSTDRYRADLFHLKTVKNLYTLADQLDFYLKCDPRVRAERVWNAYWMRHAPVEEKWGSGRMKLIFRIGRVEISRQGKLELNYFSIPKIFTDFLRFDGNLARDWLLNHPFMARSAVERHSMLINDISLKLLAYSLWFQSWYLRLLDWRLPLGLISALSSRSSRIMSILLSVFAVIANLMLLIFFKYEISVDELNHANITWQNFRLVVRGDDAIDSPGIVFADVPAPYIEKATLFNDSTSIREFTESAAKIIYIIASSILLFFAIIRFIVVVFSVYPLITLKSELRKIKNNFRQNGFWLHRLRSNLMTIFGLPEEDVLEGSLLSRAGRGYSATMNQKRMPGFQSNITPVFSNHNKSFVHKKKTDVDSMSDDEENIDWIGQLKSVDNSVEPQIPPSDSFINKFFASRPSNVHLLKSNTALQNGVFNDDSDEILNEAIKQITKNVNSIPRLKKRKSKGFYDDAILEEDFDDEGLFNGSPTHLEQPMIGNDPSGRHSMFVAATPGAAAEKMARMFQASPISGMSNNLNVKNTRLNPLLQLIAQSPHSNLNSPLQFGELAYEAEDDDVQFRRRRLIELSENRRGTILLKSHSNISPASKTKTKRQQQAFSKFKNLLRWSWCSSVGEAGASKSNRSKQALRSKLRRIQEKSRKKMAKKYLKEISRDERRRQEALHLKWKSHQVALEEEFVFACVARDAFYNPGILPDGNFYAYNSLLTKLNSFIWNGKLNSSKQNLKTSSFSVSGHSNKSEHKNSHFLNSNMQNSMNTVSTSNNHLRKRSHGSIFHLKYLGAKDSSLSSMNNKSFDRLPFEKYTDFGIEKKFGIYLFMSRTKLLLSATVGSYEVTWSLLQLCVCILAMVWPLIQVGSLLELCVTFKLLDLFAALKESVRVVIKLLFFSFSLFIIWASIMWYLIPQQFVIATDSWKQRPFSDIYMNVLSIISLQGLRKRSGIADSVRPFWYFEPVQSTLKTPSQAIPSSSDFYVWWIIEILFILAVNFCIMKLSLAMLVDGLEKDRNLHHQRLVNQSSECVVCGLHRSVVNRAGPGFQYHMNHEHDGWLYCAFVSFLAVTPPADFDGSDLFAMNLINSDSISFLPLNRALNVKESEPSHQFQDLACQVKDLLQKSRLYHLHAAHHFHSYPHHSRNKMNNGAKKRVESYLGSNSNFKIRDSSKTDIHFRNLSSGLKSSPILYGPVSQGNKKEESQTENNPRVAELLVVLSRHTRETDDIQVNSLYNQGNLENISLPLKIDVESLADIISARTSREGSISHNVNATINANNDAILSNAVDYNVAQVGLTTENEISIDISPDESSSSSSSSSSSWGSWMKINNRIDADQASPPIEPEHYLNDNHLNSYENSNENNNSDLLADPHDIQASNVVDTAPLPRTSSKLPLAIPSISNVSNNPSPLPHGVSARVLSRRSSVHSVTAFETLQDFQTFEIQPPAFASEIQLAANYVRKSIHQLAPRADPQESLLLSNPAENLINNTNSPVGMNPSVPLSENSNSSLHAPPISGNISPLIGLASNSPFAGGSISGRGSCTERQPAIDSLSGLSSEETDVRSMGGGSVRKSRSRSAVRRTRREHRSLSHGVVSRAEKEEDAIRQQLMHVNYIVNGPSGIHRSTSVFSVGATSHHHPSHTLVSPASQFENSALEDHSILEVPINRFDWEEALQIGQTKVYDTSFTDKNQAPSPVKTPIRSALKSLHVTDARNDKIEHGDDKFSPVPEIHNFSPQQQNNDDHHHNLRNESDSLLSMSSNHHQLLGSYQFRLSSLAKTPLSVGEALLERQVGIANMDSNEVREIEDEAEKRIRFARDLEVVNVVPMNRFINANNANSVDFDIGGKHSRRKSFGDDVIDSDEEILTGYMKKIEYRALLKHVKAAQLTVLNKRRQSISSVAQLKAATNALKIQSEVAGNSLENNTKRQNPKLKNKQQNMVKNLLDVLIDDDQIDIDGDNLNINQVDQVNLINKNNLHDGISSRSSDVSSEINFDPATSNIIPSRLSVSQGVPATLDTSNASIFLNVLHLAESGNIHDIELNEENGIASPFDSDDVTNSIDNSSNTSDDDLSVSNSNPSSSSDSLNPLQLSIPSRQGSYRAGSINHSAVGSRRLSINLKKSVSSRRFSSVQPCDNLLVPSTTKAILKKIDRHGKARLFDRKLTIRQRVDLLRAKSQFMLTQLTGSTPAITRLAIFLSDYEHKFGVNVEQLAESLSDLRGELNKEAVVDEIIQLLSSSAVSNVFSSGADKTSSYNVTAQDRNTVKSNIKRAIGWLLTADNNNNINNEGSDNGTFKKDLLATEQFSRQSYVNPPFFATRDISILSAFEQSNNSIENQQQPLSARLRRSSIFNTIHSELSDGARVILPDSIDALNLAPPQPPTGLGSSVRRQSIHASVNSDFAVNNSSSNQVDLNSVIHINNSSNLDGLSSSAVANDFGSSNNQLLTNTTIKESLLGTRRDVRRASIHLLVNMALQSSLKGNQISMASSGPQNFYEYVENGPSTSTTAPNIIVSEVVETARRKSHVVSPSALGDFENLMYAGGLASNPTAVATGGIARLGSEDIYRMRSFNGSITGSSRLDIGINSYNASNNSNLNFGSGEGDSDSVDKRSLHAKTTTTYGHNRRRSSVSVRMRRMSVTSSIAAAFNSYPYPNIQPSGQVSAGPDHASNGMTALASNSSVTLPVYHAPPYLQAERLNSATGGTAASNANFESLPGSSFPVASIMLSPDQDLKRILLETDEKIGNPSAAPNEISVRQQRRTVQLQKFQRSHNHLRHSNFTGSNVIMGNSIKYGNKIDNNNIDNMLKNRISTFAHLAPPQSPTSNSTLQLAANSITKQKPTQLNSYL